MVARLPPTTALWIIISRDWHCDWFIKFNFNCLQTGPGFCDERRLSYFQNQIDSEPLWRSRARASLRSGSSLRLRALFWFRVLTWTTGLIGVFFCNSAITFSLGSTYAGESGQAKESFLGSATSKLLSNPQGPTNDQTWFSWMNCSTYYKFMFWDWDNNSEVWQHVVQLCSILVLLLLSVTNLWMSMCVYYRYSNGHVNLTELVWMSELVQCWTCKLL
jgi:hypothetical protein